MKRFNMVLHEADKDPTRSEMQCETDTRECALPIQSVMSVSGSLIYRCRVFHWPFTVRWEFWYHAKSIPRTQDVLKADDLEILRGAIRGILPSSRGISSPTGILHGSLAYNMCSWPVIFRDTTRCQETRGYVLIRRLFWQDGLQSLLVINLKKPWWQFLSPCGLQS